MRGRRRAGGVGGGGGHTRKLSARWWEYMWNATPVRVRPARPRRCRSFALLIHVVCSVDTPEYGSKRFSFARPLLMTHATPSIVTAVSATFVARMILRRPGVSCTAMLLLG